MDRKTTPFPIKAPKAKLSSRSRCRTIVACDLSAKSGEGRLALLHIKNTQYLSMEINLIESFLKTKNKHRLPPLFQFKFRALNSFLAYFWLVYQITYLRLSRSPDTVILNYLPLWNVFFFLLVPKSASLGPITGGGRINLRHLGCSKVEKLIFHLTRNIMVPLLYRVSCKIIRWRSLEVRPATPSVARALGFTSITPRAIETDTTLFEIGVINETQKKRKIDLVCYVGPHPLKNTKLTVSVLNRLAEAGYVISLIGSVPKNIYLHKDIKYHFGLTRDEVISLIGNSVAVLSLSLEEAGFFTFEAAACGCFILCLPCSGGAVLPGARKLLLETETVTEEVLYQRCDDIMKKVTIWDEGASRQRSQATKEKHTYARNFFYQN